MPERVHIVVPGNDALLLLVGHDPREGDPGAVVDPDLDEFPADTAGARSGAPARPAPGL